MCNKTCEESDEEQEDLMEELSACVTKHVKMSRAKKKGTCSG